MAASLAPSQEVPSHSQPQPRRIRWANVLLAGTIHAGCLAALFYFSWSAVGVSVFMGWVSCCLGITLGWHRLLTHRSFQTYKPIEYFLTLLGCLAWQNGPIEWVGTHRLHHAHTDNQQDPHSPRPSRNSPQNSPPDFQISPSTEIGPTQSDTTFSHQFKSFLWSHMGWIFVQPTFDSAAAARDLGRDRGMVIIDRLHWVPGLLLIPLLYFLGEHLAGKGQGLPWVVWGSFVRTTLFYHATWFVNSASHVWGYRNFETMDDSTNLWWVAIVSFGEGWHNNHHAQQNSAAHGMKWWEFDLTWQIIRLMRACRISWNVVEPKLEKLIRGRTVTS